METSPPTKATFATMSSLLRQDEGETTSSNSIELIFGNVKAEGTVNTYSKKENPTTSHDKQFEANAHSCFTFSTSKKKINISFT